MAETDLSANDRGSCETLESAILTAGRRVVVATAGGGSGAISRLLGVPGSSATVLEGVALQAQRSMTDWLGAIPDQFCSEATARAMAMAAWRRATTLSETSDAERCVGVGVTAALATTRPKRGAHRVYVAVQSADETVALTVKLEKDARSRAEEEAVAERATLATLADAIGAKPMDLSKAPPGMRSSVRRQTAESAWRELMLGQRSSVRIGADDCGPPGLLIPGSFNPPHRGHAEIARVAAAKAGAAAVFELSITNVDKPPLDYLEIADRLAAIGAAEVLLTTAPTFVEKARLVPGCVFAVGADTIQRLADPRYCSGGVEERNAQFAEIAELGCRFLVFGRLIDGRFVELDQLDLPPGLRRLCEGLSEQVFRQDISSTELRTG